MKHISLFSGIGGFDLAAEWMGWENVAHCEWNDFGQKVLKYYWPKAISYNDITKTDFSIHRGAIDILTGGFPCQPYSTAGKRLGKEDERHLWPEMLRAIREIQPIWVVGENVSGIVNWNGGMVFDEVQADLEAAGYEVLPFLLPAAGVNTPHKRERVWFIAYATGKLQQGNEPRKCGDKRRENVQQEYWPTNPEQPGTMGKSWFAPYSQSWRSGGLRNPLEKAGASKSNITLRGFCGVSSNVADTNSRRQPCEEYGEKESGRFTEKGVPGDWENFPTQSPICMRNDGISNNLVGITFPKWRNESIKAFGNAIVPQVALQIFLAIEQMENLL